MLLHLHGVDGNPTFDFLLLGWVKKPTFHPNRRVGLRAKCFVQRHDIVPHLSLPPPWTAGLDHRHDPSLERVWQTWPCLDDLAKVWWKVSRVVLF
jgi:hypothetical protein